MNRADRAELGRPRRDVRGLPAGAEPDLGVGVPAGGDRPGEPDDDVEGEVTERADEHRERDRKIRAWTEASDAAGFAPSSSEGSSARPPRSRRSTVAGGRSGAAAEPRGLAAFESAPCYLELLERERDRGQGRARSGR